MNELIVQAREKIGEIEALMGKMREFSQPRSAYTIKTHIISAEHSPERQYKQVMDELWVRWDALQSTMYQHELALIDLEETQDKQTTEENKYESRRLQLQEKELNRKIMQLEHSLEGTIREVIVLLDIKNGMKDYSWQDYEDSEPDYWRRRLAEQWVMSRIDPTGNLSAILNLFTPAGGYRPQIAALDDAVKSLGLKIDQEMIDGQVVLRLEKGDE